MELCSNKDRFFLWWLIWFQASKPDYNIFSCFSIKSKLQFIKYFIFIHCIVFFEDVVFCCLLFHLEAKAW